ncbi:hypothetical protein PROFUN_10208 [Planoprotostelium fungivorum]|uniref:BRCT domain-containing protein n=1 Tax=Planoprotostelium fungivorum TaxID=1890364 RepID=A0A2P6MQ48_9EUKA|nr:hypothetical protein PROFUN_10208 [Planoprotostelium fungivorum]
MMLVDLVFLALNREPTIYNVFVVRMIISRHRKCEAHQGSIESPIDDFNAPTLRDDVESIETDISHLPSLIPWKRAAKISNPDTEGQIDLGDSEEEGLYDPSTAPTATTQNKESSSDGSPERSSLRSSFDALLFHNDASLEIPQSLPLTSSRPAPTPEQQEEEKEFFKRLSLRRSEPEEPVTGASKRLYESATSLKSSTIDKLSSGLRRSKQLSNTSTATQPTSTGGSTEPTSRHDQEISRVKSVSRQEEKMDNMHEVPDEKDESYSNAQGKRGDTRKENGKKEEKQKIDVEAGNSLPFLDRLPNEESVEVLECSIPIPKRTPNISATKEVKKNNFLSAAKGKKTDEELEVERPWTSAKPTEETLSELSEVLKAAASAKQKEKETKLEKAKKINVHLPDMRDASKNIKANDKTQQRSTDKRAKGKKDNVPEVAHKKQQNQVKATQKKRREEAKQKEEEEDEGEEEEEEEEEEEVEQVKRKKEAKPQKDKEEREGEDSEEEEGDSAVEETYSKGQNKKKIATRKKSKTQTKEKSRTRVEDRSTGKSGDRAKDTAREGKKTPKTPETSEEESASSEDEETQTQAQYSGSSEESADSAEESDLDENLSLEEMTGELSKTNQVNATSGKIGKYVRGTAFKGMQFIITGIEETSRLTDLEHNIMLNGGYVVEEIEMRPVSDNIVYLQLIDIQRKNNSMFLISDKPRETKKYQLALASCIPCVHYKWLEALLCKWLIIHNTSFLEASLLLKASSSQNVRIEIVSDSHSFKEHFNQVLRLSEALVLQRLHREDEINLKYVLCEEAPDQETKSKCKRNKIQIINRTWVVQSLIHGQLMDVGLHCDFTSFPKKKRGNKMSLRRR